MFAEIYTIVLFCIGALTATYMTGSGKSLYQDGTPMLFHFIGRWIVLLPLVGKVFGWW